MRIDVQRLRVQRQQAEHCIVHLGHGPAERVIEILADLELLEIQTRHVAPPFFPRRDQIIGRYHSRAPGKASSRLTQAAASYAGGSESNGAPGFSPGAPSASGGAKRDRTADLYNAIVALSQLSYGPEPGISC